MRVRVTYAHREHWPKEFVANCGEVWVARLDNCWLNEVAHGVITATTRDDRCIVSFICLCDISESREQPETARDSHKQPEIESV